MKKLPLNFKVNGKNFVASVVYTKGGMHLHTPKWGDARYITIPRGYYLNVVRGKYNPGCSVTYPWALNRSSLLFTVGRRSKKQARRAALPEIYRPALINEIKLIKKRQAAEI